jgi:hypothetical protein
MQGVRQGQNWRFRHRHRGASIRAKDVTDWGAVISKAFRAPIRAGGAQVNRGQAEDEDRDPTPHYACTRTWS